MISIQPIIYDERKIRWKNAPRKHADEGLPRSISTHEWIPRNKEQEKHEHRRTYLLTQTDPRTRIEWQEYKWILDEIFLKPIVQKPVGIKVFSWRDIKPGLQWGRLEEGIPSGPQRSCLLCIRNTEYMILSKPQ
jgi:hypothetical protein